MFSIYSLKSIRIILTVLLVCSLLINGCASYFPLTIEDKFEGMQLDNQDIILILQDGTRFESKAYLHVLVESPSDLVYGIGYNRNNPSHDFRGTLLLSLVDSFKNVTINAQTIESGGKSLICWLKDGQTVIFREHNYLRITPGDSTGFFCIGTSGVQDKITLTNIKEFKVRKISASSFAILSISIFLVLYGFIWLSQRHITLGDNG